MNNTNKYELYWLYLEIKHGNKLVDQEIQLRNLMQEVKDFVNLKLLRKKWGEDD